ncbi:hypothetical protein [Priestia koreensis]|uniref:Uncharacterized protein n=1 Tax=Priestia koreensis TaxID=284581 RepID=A0A0M0L5W2_9BACI|nr:hypothetical protein [Priestia koreensis]KOO46446.1 hypothetical protein AMD01_11500 [Priestia koreensis]
MQRLELDADLKINFSLVSVPNNKELKKLLTYCLLLHQHAHTITSTSSFTLKDVLYAQYEWVLLFTKNYTEQYRTDEGFQQHLLDILETIEVELGNVDWALIQSFEEK